MNVNKREFLEKNFRLTIHEQEVHVWWGEVCVLSFESTSFYALGSTEQEVIDELYRTYKSILWGRTMRGIVGQRFL